MTETSASALNAILERISFEHKEHIWVEEWPTGHKVCGWCNACEGGCERK